jgi:hypothetical protein
VRAANLTEDIAGAAKPPLHKAGRAFGYSKLAIKYRAMDRLFWLSVATLALSIVALIVLVLA